MRKKELVLNIADKLEISQTDALKAVDAVIETITNALERHEKVQIFGFGTFEVKQRAARTGKNPKTGERIEIAASVSPCFKAGKELKAKVKAFTDAI